MHRASGKESLPGEAVDSQNSDFVVAKEAKRRRAGESCPPLDRRRED